MKRVLFAVSLMMMTGACAPEQPVQDASVPDEATGEALDAVQQYDLTGVVKEVNAETGALKIDHEAIGDWMGAMTMTFNTRGLSPDQMPEVGDAITAKVNVDGSDYWLTDVSSSGPAPEADADEMMSGETHSEMSDHDQHMENETDSPEGENGN